MTKQENADALFYISLQVKSIQLLQVEANMLGERMWTLDKMEIGALRDYHTKLQNARDEINTIVCENWDKIRDEQLLTMSILRRLHNFYKISRKRNEELEVGRMGTAAGEYIEEIVHSSLSSFLSSRLKNVLVRRDFSLRKLSKVKQTADVAVLVGGEPVYIIECKAGVWGASFGEIYNNQIEAKEEGVSYACIAATMPQEFRAGRNKDKESARALSTVAKEARQKPNQWLYVLTYGWFGYEESDPRHIKESEIKVQDALETLYEYILNICKL
jgi:hypothetical protein